MGYFTGSRQVPGDVEQHDGVDEQGRHLQGHGGPVARGQAEGGQEQSQGEVGRDEQVDHIEARMSLQQQATVDGRVQAAVTVCVGHLEGTQREP